jgi:hypothetical protein
MPVGRRSHVKRMLGAVAVCLAVGLIANEVLGLAWNAAFLKLPHWAAYVFAPAFAVSTLAGVAVGTFVARGRFLYPALVLWLLSTVIVLSVGYRAQVAGMPMSFVDYLAFNLPGIGSRLVASALGLALGSAAYNRWSSVGRASNNSSKPTPLRGAA